MHIYLSLFPRLWGQRERNPPSYDSRVHGLTRLLGTSPPRSSPLPPPAPPSCLSSCQLVLLGLLLVSPLPQGRPAVDRSKVIAPCFVSMVDGVVPTLASFSSRPCGLVREWSPLLVDRGHHYLIVEHITSSAGWNTSSEKFSRPRQQGWLSKDEKVSPSRLPVNEPMTGTLEHRASRSFAATAS